MKFTCTKCGNTFEIPQAEIVKLVSENKPVPQLCPACRGIHEEAKPQKTKSSGGVQFKKTFGGAHEEPKPQKPKTSGGIEFKTPYGGDDDTFDPSTIQSENRHFKRPSQKVATIVAAIVAVLAMVVFVTVFGRSTHKPHHFRDRDTLIESFEQNGMAMGFDDADVYEQYASDLINNKSAIKVKSKETGQTIYYLEEENQVVLVYKGYIISYFMPEEGKDYLETVH